MAQIDLKPFDYVAIAAAVVALIALIIGAVAVAKPVTVPPQARSALVSGNNGTLPCSTFCNNVTYFQLKNQVPTITSWNGATSFNDATVANGVEIGSVGTVGNSGICLCVEDPSAPLDSMPR